MNLTFGGAIGYSSGKNNSKSNLPKSLNKQIISQSRRASMIFRFHGPSTAVRQGSHGLNRGWFLDMLLFRWLKIQLYRDRNEPVFILDGETSHYRDFHFYLNNAVF